MDSGSGSVRDFLFRQKRGSLLNFFFNNSIIDPRVNPVLANGNIGFTVFDTSVYMNGLYNGKGPKTHRARIENHANFQTEICNVRRKMATKCRYRFNIRTGIFEVIFDSPEYKMKHEVFPHRFYTRTIVNRFSVERKTSKEEIRIPVSMNAGDIGLDLSFPEHRIYQVGNFNVTLESGHTLVVENEEYQKSPHKLTFAFTKVNELLLPVGEYRLTQHAFMTIDPEETIVTKEIERVITDRQVVEKHEKEWISFWDNFDIEIENRIEMVSNFCFALITPDK